MERNRQPIGVFDSGVGGLTVVKKLRMLLPHENIIYVGDTKRNPYGSRTPEEIFSYTRDILRFMSEKEVKLVAIGCNTVTAVAYETVRQEVPYPLIGMSRGIRTAREISARKKIAVFATDLTIANHSHKNEELCGDTIAFVDPAHEMALQTLEVLKKGGLLNHDRLPGYLRLCFTAEARRGGKLAEHLIPANEFTVEEISFA